MWCRGGPVALRRCRISPCCVTTTTVWSSPPASRFAISGRSGSPATVCPSSPHPRGRIRSASRSGTEGTPGAKDWWPDGRARPNRVGSGAVLVGWARGRAGRRLRRPVGRWIAPELFARPRSSRSCPAGFAALAVGRAPWLATPGLRDALIARDGGCTFPGCDGPVLRCEAHHVVPWWAGGATARSNLASC